MQYLKNLFPNLPPWLIIIPIIFVLYFIGYLIYVKKSRKKQKSYMDENPTVSKLYCEIAQKGIRSVQIYIHSIDEDTNIGLKAFNEGTKYAYMLLPGKHVIEASATTQRPGIIHKNIIETYGPEKLEINVGQAKKYELGFDVKKEEFIFTEL